ncbi:MAG: polysaccharide biosynthesis tyrosine autokinase [Pedosphaera sp.]|nr:polysaccharide biosynthesis tyrosine autokinase [Pedosphaera sp.]
MDAPKNPTSPETKLHFLDYWRIIRIRKTVILAVFLLVVLTTTAVTFILPESFSSTVRIEVGKDTTDIAPLLMGGQGPASYDPYFITTEFEKIRSKTVLHQVITNMGLQTKWIERFHTEGELKLDEVFQILSKQIDLRQTRNTSLIEIRVYSEDPKEAADIANKIADVYTKLRLKKTSSASTNSITILRIQLKEQEALMNAAQEDMDRLRKELKVGDLDAGGPISILEPETLRMIERDRIQAESAFVMYDTILKELKSKNKAELRRAVPTASPDTHLSELLSKYYQTENAFSTMVNSFGPENPQLKDILSLMTNLNAQIEERVDGILAGLATQASAQKARASSLSNQVEVARTEDGRKMEQYRPYFKAKREVETKQRIYETINLRILQETVDSSLPKQSIVQIIDGAEPSKRAVRPNIPLNIALGVIVGLIMGFGLAFFIEYLDTSVKTIDDVERALQAPVLGVIPQNVGALIDEGPESPHAEAYRVLRTNVLFSRKDPLLNSLTVVSGGAGEGKSTTIFNLATVFAQNGQRVLIVDSDLRRPSLHKLLNVSNSIGLTNYLLKQNSLEEVIQTTSVPTLHFMPSGKLPSSSLGILNSTQMKEFIQTVKKRYDFVFFDSPPIMGVSDASILASEVDMALLVIQYRKYPQAMTLRAKQMVEKVGGTLLGVVLNNINISQDSYYYYYSGYYYDYYSKHDDDSSAKKNGAKKTPEIERGGIDLKQKY